MLVADEAGDPPSSIQLQDQVSDEEADARGEHGDSADVDEAVASICTVAVRVDAAGHAKTKLHRVAQAAIAAGNAALPYCDTHTPLEPLSRRSATTSTVCN